MKDGDLDFDPNEPAKSNVPASTSANKLRSTSNKIKKCCTANDGITAREKARDER
jgi:hypothetical protein